VHFLNLNQILMRKIIVFAVLFTFGFKLIAQIPVKNPHEGALINDSLKSPRISGSLNMGTSIISTRGAGRGSSFFIAPEINYQFSPRFELNAGMVITQNNYSLPVEMIGSDKSMVVRSVPVSNQNMFYASGNYLITPNILFSGSLVTSFPGSQGSQQNAGWNNSFQIMSMGLTYKVTNSLSVGASMSMVQSSVLNNYYYPMYRY
jgi:hypothetical protein